MGLLPTLGITTHCWVLLLTMVPMRLSSTRVAWVCFPSGSMPGFQSSSISVRQQNTLQIHRSNIRSGSAEDCLRRGADAVSVHVNLGSPTEDQQIRMMAEVADSCDRVGLPLLAMLYPRGPGIQNHPLSQTLQHAASLAVDLGADIVKLPLSGSVQEMTHVVDSCSIPVLSAGGSQVSDDEFGIFVANVMKSGARGLAADVIFSWRQILEKKCVRSDKFSSQIVQKICNILRSRSIGQSATLRSQPAADSVVCGL